MAIVVLAGLLGLRNFASSDPLPTLAPTAAVVEVTDEPKATATATATATNLPPTNTPRATTTEEVTKETATPAGTALALATDLPEPSPTHSATPTPSPGPPRWGGWWKAHRWSFWTCFSASSSRFRGRAHGLG